MMRRTESGTGVAGGIDATSRPRRVSRRWSAGWAAALAAAFGCGSSESPAGPIEVGEGPGSSTVSRDPFGLTVALANETRWSAPESDLPELGLVSFGIAERINPFRFYDPAEPVATEWIRPGRVRSAREERDGSGTMRRVVLDVEVPPQLGAGLDVEVEQLCAGDCASAVRRRTRVTMAVREPASIVLFARVAWALESGEGMYGLGERFGAPDLRGEVHAMQLLPANTASGLNEVHVPIPWVVSTRGYAVLVESYRPAAADLGATVADAATFTVAGESLRFDVFAAPDPWTLVPGIWDATGAPRMPPEWSFGPQLWRNELTDRAELEADAAAIREHDLPVSVLWIDNPWQTSYNDFTFNTLQFPEPQTMIDALHDGGFKVLTWSTPYVDTTDDSDVREGMRSDTGGLYEEGAAAGYFVRGPTGEPAGMPWGSGRMGGMLDFPNPAASAWWTGLVRRVTRMGIDGFKLDYGEIFVGLLGSRLDVTYGDGGTEADWHARYAILYDRAYRAALEADRPDGFLIGRGSAMGGQADVDCIWPGDLENDLSDFGEDRGDGERSVGGLSSAVHGLMSLSVSGFPVFGSDTGGYRGGLPASEALVRWGAHTAFTPVMQVGGAGRSHNPWDTTLFPEPWVLSAMRKFMKTHQRLVPYLYDRVCRAHQGTVPPILPLGLAYADDPAARADGCAYLLGDRMLVAPACRGEDPRRVHLPAGTWVDWWTGEVHEGPADLAMPNPIDAIPVFLAAGAVVPLFPHEVDTMVPSTDPEVVSIGTAESPLVWRVVPAGVDGPGEGTVWAADGCPDDVSGTLRVVADGDCQRFEGGTQDRLPAAVLELDWQAFSDAAPREVSGFARAADRDAVLAGCDRCWFHDAADGKLYASPVPASICR